MTSPMVSFRMLSGGYVTLWRHRDSLDSRGRVWQKRGTIGTTRWPAEDILGLAEMAHRQWWFPWPVGAEPDLTAVPIGKTQGIDARAVILQAWDACRSALAQGEPPPPPAAGAKCPVCEWVAPSASKSTLRSHIVRKHGRDNAGSVPAFTNGKAPAL